MSQRTKQLTRRNFLLTVGAGGAATATAIVATKSPSTKSTPANDKRATRGSQSSEHVNNYYRTAKV